MEVRAVSEEAFGQGNGRWFLKLLEREIKATCRWAGLRNPLWAMKMPAGPLQAHSGVRCGRHMMGCDHKSEHSRRSAATGRPSDATFLFFFFHFSPKGRTVLEHIVEEAVSSLLGVLQVTELQGSVRVGRGSVTAPLAPPPWVGAKVALHSRCVRSSRARREGGRATLGDTAGP